MAVFFFYQDTVCFVCSLPGLNSSETDDNLEQNKKRTKNISAATEQTPFMVFGDRSGKTFRKAVFLLLFLSRTTRVCNCFYSIMRRISFHEEFCEFFCCCC